MIKGGDKTPPFVMLDSIKIKVKKIVLKYIDKQAFLCYLYSIKNKNS